MQVDFGSHLRKKIGFSFLSIFGSTCKCQKIFLQRKCLLSKKRKRLPAKNSNAWIAKFQLAAAPGVFAPLLASELEALRGNWLNRKLLRLVRTDVTCLASWERWEWLEIKCVYIYGYKNHNFKFLPNIANKVHLIIPLKKI